MSSLVFSQDPLASGLLSGSSKHKDLLQDFVFHIHTAIQFEDNSPNVFNLVMGHSLDMGHLAITVSHILK